MFNDAFKLFQSHLGNIFNQQLTPNKQEPKEKKSKLHLVFEIFSPELLVQFKMLNKEYNLHATRVLNEIVHLRCTYIFIKCWSHVNLKKSINEIKYLNKVDLQKLVEKEKNPDSEKSPLEKLFDWIIPSASIQTENLINKTCLYKKQQENNLKYLMASIKFSNSMSSKRVIRIYQTIIYIQNQMNLNVYEMDLIKESLKKAEEEIEENKKKKLKSHLAKRQELLKKLNYPLDNLQKKKNN